MNHLYPISSETLRVKESLNAGGALIASVSLVAFTIFITLYYTNTYCPGVSLYLLLGPEAGGVALGLTLMAIAYCIKSSKPEQGEWVTELILGNQQGEMAKKWASHALKDAATRIFPDPLRSFLELVVNSLDASLPLEKNVGKFGMGFISILSFLDHPETKGSLIQIETTYQNEERLVSYRMDLAKERAQYTVQFTQQDPKGETGTSITISPKQGTFSQETLDTLLHYCQTLQFYEHGQIEITSGEDVPILLGEGKETLAWVSLEKTQITVRDRGCGISEKIARSTLFIPSVSTKTVSTSVTSTETKLPEFKEFKGKRDGHNRLLIAISGILVIDIPFKGSVQKDLLIRMQPQTQLTLARDAIEFSQNKKASAIYLRKVIKATLDGIFADEQVDPYLLLSLYEGLKEWESRVPSVGAVKLSSYLENLVQKRFREQPNLIPYPLEQKAMLLPLLSQYELNQFIAFPSQLLFDDFTSLEDFLKGEFQKTASTEIEQRAINLELISGKSVIFVEDLLLKKVSSFGLKGIVFAPRSLLETCPTEEELQFALIHQFIDTGKKLCVAEKEKSSSLPKELALFKSPKNILFGIGRKKQFHFDQYVNINRIFGNGLLEKVPDDVFIALAEREDEWTSRLLQNSRNICGTVDDFLGLVLNLKFSSRNLIKHELESALNTCIYWKDGEYFIVENTEIALASIEPIIINHIGCEYTEFDKAVEKGVNLEKFLKKIEKHQAFRFFFESIFSNFITSKAVRLFSSTQEIWPLPENCNAQFFQNVLELLDKQNRWTCLCRPYMGLDVWHGFQIDHWKVLEPFLDYPEGEKAIHQLLPLLQLQESLVQGGLSDELYRYLDMHTKCLISCYHRFLTIQDGELASAYNEKRKTIFFVNGQGRDYKDLFFIYGQRGDCTIADQILLLSSLKRQPDLFKKAVTLLMQSLIDKLDITQRNRDWSKGHKVNLGDILDDNGFAFLCILKQRGIDDFYLETILTYVTNPFELRILSQILLVKKITQRFNSAKEIEKEKLGFILKEIITHYLQTKVNQNDLAKRLKNSWRQGFRRTKRIDELKPIFHYLETTDEGYFETDLHFVPSSFQTKITEASSFTSQQIMHSAQNQASFLSTLQTGVLRQAVAMVKQAPKESHLRMITQAVEHGSERGCAEASLIEAFQNSVDAIREHVRKNPTCSAEKTKVSFDVRVVQENPESEARLLLDISDQIGMANIKTLLADFLIPNYSEKGKKSTSVGEMGNGSYQMYRDAEMVTLMTRTTERPSKVYFLRIIPLRNADREVYDLSHKCIDVTDLVDPQFVGTQLRILKGNPQNISRIGIELEGAAVRHFIRETFSVAKPPLDFDHTLTIEVKLSNHEIASLCAIDPKQTPFMSQGASLSCYKMRDEDGVGYVLTDGYPFKPLAQFLKDEKLLPEPIATEFSKGWVLNIPAGDYAPVQSRTRLQLTKEVKEQLKQFLLDWIYHRSFLQETNGPAQHYYPHFKSKCPQFNQIFPSSNTSLSQHDIGENLLIKGNFASLESFFIHFVPSFMQKSFCARMEEVYTTLVFSLEQENEALVHAVQTELTVDNRKRRYHELVDQFQKTRDEIFNQWQHQLNASTEGEERFFTTVLIPWFKDKVAYLPCNVPSLAQLIEKNPALQTEEEKEKTQLNLEKIEKAMQKISVPNLAVTLRSMITSYCKIYATHIPLSKIEDLEIELFYNPSLSSNSSYHAMGHRIRINVAHLPISHLLEIGIQIAQYKPVTSNTFISIIPGFSGALNHELEHARRGDSCDDGKDVHGYGTSVEGEYVDFESCAASYARKAHQNGLMNSWAKALNELPLPTYEELQTLKDLEKINPRAVANFLLNNPAL